MKYLRFAREFVEWVWDWYVFPVVELFLPQKTSESQDEAETPHDHGQTLDEE